MKGCRATLPHVLNTIDLAAGYPSSGPSLTGSTYLAAHGSEQVVVGATRQFDVSVQDALSLCDPAVAEKSSSEAQAAAEKLLADMSGSWPAIARWNTDKIRYNAAVATLCIWLLLTKLSFMGRSGVRALPPRRQAGKLPLLGRLQNVPDAWLVAGLGARGLVYHAWLARMLVDAIIADDDAMLLKDLTAWQKSA